MTEPASALPCPDATVLALAGELARTEARCATLAQARRWSLLGIGLAAAIGGFVAGTYVATPAMAQTQGTGGQAAQPAQFAPAPTREQLMAMLPADERARLEEFEQKAAWVSQYTRASPQFDAGAAIALFLGNMAKAMESVPKMHAEMQVMNGKMNALPFLANEVAGMNAKMGVMAADMDSTMGRAGRMMPWGW
jgi:hypothetical protein